MNPRPSKIILDENHKYHLGDIKGKIVPGVSEILKAGGFLPDFTAVNDDVMARAQAFGKAVHKTIALFNAGNLNLAVLDEALRPYLAAWKKFTDDNPGWELLSGEESLYSETWGFCGTYDAFGMIGKRHVLIDFKTSTTISPATDLQLAAYEILIREKYQLNSFLINKDSKVDRIVLQLFPGRYKAKRCDGLNDRAIFLSALNGFKWKKIKGLIKNDR